MAPHAWITAKIQLKACSSLSSYTNNTASIGFRSSSCRPQGEDGAIIGPSVEELAQAQHRVREQHELEEELQVVRDFNAGGIQHLGGIMSNCNL
jgi:hypothetical protein